MKNLALNGSIAIVVEYFEYAINSILYQRNLYPPEDFKLYKKYNLNLLKTDDSNLINYLNRILTQLNHWLSSSKLCKVILIVSSIETRQVLERWQFDIQIDNSPNNKENNTEKTLKTEAQINSEISTIIKQITASVTFLPILDPSECTFNVLAYTDRDATVPLEWIDSDPRMIDKNAEQVKLRSFSTQAHKIDTLVQYSVTE